jgi:hypothetical protein
MRNPKRVNTAAAEGIAPTAPVRGARAAIRAENPRTKTQIDFYVVVFAVIYCRDYNFVYFVELLSEKLIWFRTVQLGIVVL